MAPCCICKAEAKYRCPTCNRRTCSLKCIEIHKATWGCSGKRRRTDYISVKSFTDNNLISDLHFLEDVKRIKEANWANLRRVALVFRPQEIPPHQRKLRYEARMRLIRLHFLPRGMTRNKTNSSWFDFRNAEIWWDIDWILAFDENRPRVHKKRMSEALTVKEALASALQSVGMEAVGKSVVMQRIACPSNALDYFHFDLDATLRSQLEATEIVEYPILMVINNIQLKHYPLYQPPTEAVIEVQS